MPSKDKPTQPTFFWKRCKSIAEKFDAGLCQPDGVRATLDRGPAARQAVRIMGCTLECGKQGQDQFGWRIDAQSTSSPKCLALKGAFDTNSERFVHSEKTESSKNKMKKSEAMYIATDENSPSAILDSVLGVHKEVDRNLAQHLNASPNLLEKLSRRKDKATKTLAIIHSNFPPDRLIHVPSIQLMDLICSAAFPKMSPPQLSEMFRLLDRVKVDQLLSLHDCPLNALEWAVDAGSDHDRLLVAEREYLPAIVKEKLIALGGEISAAASKPRGLVLNRLGKVIGDYQKNMEINSLDIDFELYELKMEWSDLEFEKYAQALMEPTRESCINLENNDVVESIRLNINRLEIDCIILENLKNLRVLEIDGKLGDRRATLTWLACKNLPSLEKVVIKGRVRWLELDEVPRLQSVHLDGCQLLAHLAIRNAVNLNSLNIDGCRLLRDVAFTDVGKYESLEVLSKIQANQKKSSKEIKLKKSMTFTEIDATLDVINEGYKLAIRKNLLCSLDGSIDHCYGRENDPDFHPFSFRILSPFESVNAGGTGETYFYEHCSHDYVDGKYGVWGSIGCEDAEDCLEESLRTVIGLTTGYSSTTKLLKFFVDLLTQLRVETGENHQLA